MEQLFSLENIHAFWLNPQTAEMLGVVLLASILTARRMYGRDKAKNRPDRVKDEPRPKRSMEKGEPHHGNGIRPRRGR